MIPVTKPFLPNKINFFDRLNIVFENEILTNRGPLVLELEKIISKKLDTPNLILTSNGTIPLQLAIKILGQGGEIITTPFSYVATTAAIVWENCKPVFVDIDPNNLTIDETKIEQAITNKTTCILATHVFGNPCDVYEIERIAKKHNLNVIYDGAHSFGVNYLNNSIFEFGDITTCSFHATKLFQTAEGGAFFVKNSALFNELYFSHKFGHDGPEKFHGLGLNAKMSELNAALGLSILPYLEEIIEKRKSIYKRYKKMLDGIQVDLFEPRINTEWNYSYVPVIFKNEKELLKTKGLLESHDIWPRRYFFPSLNNLPYIKNNTELPISERISRTILCLPSYHTLEINDVDRICSLIRNSFENDQ